MGSNVPIFVATETWLKSYITDAQILIAKYVPFRCGRSHRTRGGTIFYIHEDIAVSNLITYDDTVGEVILCPIPTISIVFISIYRPPRASLKSSSSTSHLILIYLQKENIATNIMGDFNFPKIDKGYSFLYTLSRP